MFIYRFSKLIKSKLIWCFLIFLMAFAFVFADACSSSSANPSQITTIADEDVAPEIHAGVQTYLNLVDAKSLVIDEKGFHDYIGLMMAGSPEAYRSQMAMPYFFDGSIWSATHGQQGQDPEVIRQRVTRRYWECIAAIYAGQRMGILPADEDAALDYLTKIYAAREGDAKDYNPQNAYAADLKKLGLDDIAFKRLYGNVIFPLIATTHAVESTTGWVSPMELDFNLSVRYDETVARTLTIKDIRDVTTIAVDEAAVSAHYEAHKASYMHPEKRAVETVAFPVADFIDVATKGQDLSLLAEKYFNDNGEQFKDKKYEGDVITQCTEAAKNKAASDYVAKTLNAIVAALNANPTATDLAEKFTAQVVTAHGKTATAYDNITATTAPEMDAAILDTARAMAAAAPVELCTSADGKTVYVVRLKAITPATQKTLDEVRADIVDTCRDEIIAKDLTTKTEALLPLFQQKIAEGKTLSVACDEIKAAQPDATYEVTVSGELRYTGANGPAALLAPRQFSSPRYTNATATITYVEKRYEGDKLEKATQRQVLAEQIATQNSQAYVGAWLQNNLDTNPPKDGNGVSLLTPVKK